MPGFTFPPVGRLGLTSPPSRPLILHGLRYYVPLRLPLHHPGSLRSTLVRRYLASPLSFVSHHRAGDRLLVPSLLTIPVAFPVSFLTRSLRSSRVPRLPLCAHAPFLVSGGVLPFAIARRGLIPSSKSKLSAFPVTTTGYPCFPYRPQIYNFRRSVARPTHSLHPASHPTSRLS